MSFLSLYRKYRPGNFNDIVGQKHIIQTLKNALDNGRISHAYLFAGPRGTGKTSTARVFARALNCVHGPTSEPCGECEVCRKIQTGQSIDVIEIDAASNRGIDEIRDLRERVKFCPSESNYKVYIIDEVHMLTKGAFNALLKTLEEPPEYVVFIFATTEPHQLISTILSRCQRFDFSLLSTLDIRERLSFICQQEGVEYEEEALDIIARSSDGGLRDAISMLDQFISFTNGKLTTLAIQEMLGKVENETLKEFFEYIANNDSSKAIELLNELIKNGKIVSRFVSDIIQYIRELLIIKECGIKSGILESSIDRLKLLEEENKLFDTNRLISMLDIFNDIERELRSTNSPRLVLELGIIKITSNIGISQSILEERIKKLEYRLEELEKSYTAFQEKDNIEVKIREINSRNNKTKKTKEEKEIISNNKSNEYISNSTEKNNKDEDASEAVTEEQLSIDLIKESWPSLLKRLKKEDIKAHAYLIEGKPLKFENSILYISFSEDKSFHKKGAEKEKELINKVLRKILSRNFELKFVLDNIIENESLKKDNEDISSRDLVSKVLDYFDGEIIKANYDVLKNKGVINDEYE